jgi:hypothetical protein
MRKLKNKIIDKTLTYASENWITTKRDRKQMNIFGRKLYRRILGAVYGNKKENWRILTNKEENWRILTNKEVYAMVKNPP